MKKPRIPTEAGLLKSAVHYLERFAASQAMLRRVLMRRVDRAVRAELIEREPGAEIVEKVVAKVIAAGLINDQTYADSRARTLLRRGRAPRAIAQDLRARGLGDQEITAGVAALTEEGDGDLELRAALRHAERRRLGPFGTIPEDPEAAKAKRHKDLGNFARAGFSSAVAQQILAAPSRDAAIDLLTNQG
jgi:regulatory protein